MKEQAIQAKLDQARVVGRKRALGIIRLSKSPDPASTSEIRQEKYIRAFCDQEQIDVIGLAVDKATSAFHIPPEERKVFKEWLNRPDEFDCIIYWRQDRLVRRPIDFMGMVAWAIKHGKELYSATEGFGDATSREGMLMGFLKSWQAEGESESTSVRVTGSQEELALQGRWRGGRIVYGAKAVKKVNSPGWEQVPDLGGKEYKYCREAVKRVIGGESVNAIVTDFNRRKIPSKTGRRWSANVLRQILVNQTMLDIGIVDAQEWGQLQVALKARARNRTVRTTKVAQLHDILFCGRCGAKIYRWHRRSNDTHYGRCRNEIHRSDVEHPCDLPMIRYETLQDLAQLEIEQHRGDPVWERVTNGSRQVRLDDIARELLSLMPEFTARMIDREEFMRRQTALMNEQETLERIEGQGPGWQKTGETVGQKWDRLDEEHRRLWLLRIGTTFTVDCETRASEGRRYRFASSWRTVNDAAEFRDRMVRE